MVEHCIKRRMLAGGAIALMASGLPAGAALAQADSEHTVEQVTVMATRRATDVQETPIAIQAISGETVEAKKLDRLQDVVQLAPGVTFLPANRSNTFLSIRGTSVTDDAPGADRGATLFIDEVMTTGTGDMQPDVFDLDHIEILRGPQGTLFGRNVTGGAIVIYTAPPTFTNEVKGQVTYGSDNLVELKAVANAPLSDTVAGRLAVSQ